MSKIVIVGAGAVGTTFSYTLQISGLVTEMVLIDVNKEKAEGEVMDLSHGLFFTPPVDIKTGDYSECKDAAIIVITAGAKQRPNESRLNLVDRNIAISRGIIDEIKRYTTDAIILMVTNPVDILTYMVSERFGYPKDKVIGSGTVLDTARFRYFLSANFGLDSRNVHAYIFGEHGDSEVPIWSLVNIGGISIEEHCRHFGHQCSKEIFEEIASKVKDSAYHIIEAKGATNFAVSQALLKICQAIIRDEKSILTVSTLLEGEYGIKDVALSIPCIIGKEGVKKRLQPTISTKERELLISSANSLKEIIVKL